MKDHSDNVRGFSQLSRSWWLHHLQDDDVKDELTIGFYDPEGCTSGEFSIKWVRLRMRWIPQLNAYDDAWSALFEFKDVLEKFAEIDNTKPTIDDVIAILKSCGVQDLTQSTKDMP